MAGVSMIGRTERIADRWFRICGLAVVVLLLTTVASLLVGYEGWRRPFVLAHLTALFALVPLGLVVLRRVGSRAYAERGSLLGAVQGTFAHDRFASMLVVCALVAVVVSLSQFQDGIRWLRAMANYATVSIILVLVVRYLRTR